MRLIAAMSYDRVLAYQGKMPWAEAVPEEYAHYLSLVRGHPVIMGRKTVDIFGADLQGVAKCLFMVSRSTPAAGEVPVFRELESAMHQARRLDPIFYVAGGAELYAASLPYAQEMQLSYIKGDWPGDLYFPVFDPAAWEVIHRRDEPRYEFVHYRRLG